MIRKKYQNIIDGLKAFVGCLLYLWKNYYNDIYIWTGEVRTNKNAAQFGTSLCGLKPIAFLPKKDIFFNRVESEFLHIAYNKDVLQKYRCTVAPKIIRQLLNCFLYSSSRYHLGVPQIENPILNFDAKQVNENKTKIVKKSEKDKFENEIITMSIKYSDSYFSYLFYSKYKTIDKASYKVSNLEELIAFLHEVKGFIKERDVRYFECFVSAYEPAHQKIFFDAGFNPNGYVPSWNYIKERNIFEDNIVFNYYKGSIDKNVKLIPETRKLLESLNFFEENLGLEP